MEYQRVPESVGSGQVLELYHDVQVSMARQQYTPISRPACSIIKKVGRFFCRTFSPAMAAIRNKLTLNTQGSIMAQGEFNKHPCNPLSLVTRGPLFTTSHAELECKDKAGSVFGAPCHLDS